MSFKPIEMITMAPKSWDMSVEQGHRIDLRI